VGEPADLRELYAASHRRLVVQLTAMTGGVAEAEDVVQEAFARALPRWPRLSRYDNPEAWIRTVAMNLARSQWRQLRRIRALAAQLARTDAAPELSVDHVALLAALRRLPNEQREAIVLHHIGDLAVEQVAAQLGVPTGTVKARLARGRRALALALDVHDEEVSLDG